jgi:hypothetical protein
MGLLPEPPPVPTTAVFSRTDGFCAWHCCVEIAAPRVEIIEVEGSHCGLDHHPAVVCAVAERLAKAEGAWSPFERGGWRSLVYPDHSRSN